MSRNVTPEKTAGNEYPKRVISPIRSENEHEISINGTIELSFDNMSVEDSSPSRYK